MMPPRWTGTSAGQFLDVLTSDSNASRESGGSRTDTGFWLHIRSHPNIIRTAAAQCLPETLFCATSNTASVIVLARHSLGRRKRVVAEITPIGDTTPLQLRYAQCPCNRPLRSQASFTAGRNRCC